MMDPNDVKRVLVVGAGVMGHSIAQVFGQFGMDVNLVDLESNKLDRAMALIASNLETLAECGRLPKAEIGAILDRIHPSTNLSQAAESVDFALEAVFEIPDVKRRIFSQLEVCCPAHTVMASNTSSLNIFDIIKIDHAERLVIAHWFAPPHIIPLVEVVPGPKTAHEVVDFTTRLMEKLGKKVVIMRHFVPSFIVNRIQLQIASAVWEMLEKGWAAPEEIDAAVKYSLGIRLPIVGAVQTMDFTGLDLFHDIMKSRGSVSPLLKEKVNQGHLGAKTSKGFYDYGGRSEMDILKKRDIRYLKILDFLEQIKAFEPI